MDGESESAVTVAVGAHSQSLTRVVLVSQIGDTVKTSLKLWVETCMHSTWYAHCKKMDALVRVLQRDIGIT